MRPINTLRRSTIAHASEQHPRHSEATAIEQSDGSWLLAWMEFLASDKGGEDNAPNHIVAATSHDHGVTWQRQGVLIEPQQGDVNVYSPSFLRAKDGSILLFYFRYLTLAAGVELSSSCYVRRSTDGGKTFADEVVVWSQQPYNCASNAIKRLGSGRIIFPIGHQTGKVWTPSDHSVNGCVFSDDDGQTWNVCDNWIDLPMRGAMEPHVEETQDGHVLMVMRTQLGAVFQSTSPDGGKTWASAQTTGLHAPESCPELARIPQTGDLLLLWNNSPYDPAFSSHYGKRSPLTVALSSDHGQSWHGIKDIEADPTKAYSNPACTVMTSGDVLVTYFVCSYTPAWRMGGYYNLQSSVFDLDWLYQK